MKNVLLRAPVLSRSGYGVHSRQIFKYLLEKPGLNVRVQILQWGITPWFLNGSDCDGLVAEAVSRSNFENQTYDVTFQVQLPNEWDASLGKHNVGVTAGVETTLCNPMWVSLHCEKMDKIVVPSQHTKDTLLRSGKTSTDIEVIPEGYFHELLHEPDQEIDLDLKTSFNFLTVGVITGGSPETDRKNLFYLIKWFVEEFRGNKDVGLIVKTCSGRDSRIDRRATVNVLRQVLKEIGCASSADAPKVYLLHGDMRRDDMNALYKHKNIKAFLSPTRGEGFGLPHLEAAVSGLPVIATNWSSHTEFLNEGRWLSLDYDLIDVHKDRIDNNIFVDGAQWANVREEDFKKTIKKFYKKPLLPTKWAKELSSKLQEKYAWSSLREQYDRVFAGILS